MKRFSVALAGLGAGVVALVGNAGLAPIARVCAAQAQVSYSEDIAPVFKGWCVGCHAKGGEGLEKSGLDLTTYEGLLKGTTYGPMVLPGKPDESNLVRMINGDAKLQMPFRHHPLPACDRQNIWSWIFEGAKNN